MNTSESRPAPTGVWSQEVDVVENIQLTTAEQGYLDEEVAFLQQAADVVSQKSGTKTAPESEENFQVDQGFYDHFRKLGDSILSLFTS